MKYRFILTYTETDEVQSYTRTCFPVHNDDLAVSIERENDEWYYTRKLDGKLVFEREDYAWIMSQEFDGTFEMTIYESHDNGENWYDYFTATFSRASMEIDEDNRTATLNGLKEGIVDLLKNGAKEDYDLMKLIPDSQCKTVQCQIPPALALVDENSTYIKPSFSDIFCEVPIISGGYKDDIPMYWESDKDMRNNPNGTLETIWAEAKVNILPAGRQENGILYTGFLNYRTNEQQDVSGFDPSWIFRFTSIEGTLRRADGCRLKISFGNLRQVISGVTHIYQDVYAYADVYYGPSDSSHVKRLSLKIGTSYRGDGPIYSPITLNFKDDYITPTSVTIDVNIHYIYSSLLTGVDIPVSFINLFRTNYLNTSPYFKKSRPMTPGRIAIQSSYYTSETPNNHRIIPGSDEYGGTPLYFAPPPNPGIGEWIPLAENNWNYASLWYYTPDEDATELYNQSYYSQYQYNSCWTIGTCIKYLLQKITSNKVIFAETTDYSQFLYGNPNPVEGHEPFQWLVTQKSNVMRPAAGGASRCIVRLDWFFELLRNAFNCYYWFERRNDGRYDFRIEHVEYFRRGGAYSGQLADQLDLTRLKPYRNFLRGGQPAKRYSDQTNKYTFDLDNMAEKYTFSWQGDGGSDHFKGNPMYFKAGWLEKGTSDDRQVDNIFADLGWIMLNAGSDTASSKNYDGLFLFGGYRPINTIAWSENQPPASQTLTLASGMVFTLRCDIWLTAPLGHSIYLNDGSIPIPIYTGTGQPQRIPVNITHVGAPLTVTLNFGADYNDVVIHRIHARSGDVYRVPNVTDLMTQYPSAQYTIQNGVLAWPWLQNEYLHYDIPARKWTYMKNEYTDDQGITWKNNGTIKMVKKQTVGVVPVPDAGTENNIMGIMGIKTGLGIGIIDSARINLSSRNAEMTIIYDINTNTNQ